MGKYRVVRYVAYAIETVALFVLQETPGLIPELFGARPLLLIPVALSIAMFEEEVPALCFGLAAGLFLDFGAGGTLGFYGLLLGSVCYVVSLMAANLFRTNFLTAMLVSAVSSAVILALRWVFFFVLFGYAYPAYALTAHYLPMFVYTAAIMPLTYYFNRALALQIRSKEE